MLQALCGSARSPLRPVRPWAQWRMRPAAARNPFVHVAARIYVPYVYLCPLCLFMHRRPLIKGSSDDRNAGRVVSGGRMVIFGFLCVVRGSYILIKLINADRVRWIPGRAAYGRPTALRGKVFRVRMACGCPVTEDRTCSPAYGYRGCLLSSLLDVNAAE